MEGTQPADKVLLLDDDLVVLRMLSRVLRDAGFDAITTQSQRDALEAAVAGRAWVVVCDLHMPGMMGSVVLSLIARSAPAVGRVLLTGDDDFARIAGFIAPGAVQAFVSKAHAAERLPVLLREMAEQRRRGEGPVAMEAHARELADGIVRTLALRDYETEAHCHRVAALAARLARAMGLQGGVLLNAELGALLHDMGKIGVRDAVLLKPGKLTEEEWVEMRRHPELGAQLLADMPLLRGAIDVVLNHHERWEGGGYPRNIKGEQIPLAARIFQIADTYDAIVSDRPYRKGQPPSVARAEIARHAGTQFDPGVVAAFESIDPGDWEHTWITAGGRYPRHETPACGAAVPMPLAAMGT
jgi:putative nucleotidyltransferase with HDIG domain